jgi:transcriptional regulator with XRE-family HTH domain
MPSGRKPDLERRQSALKLRDRGWSLSAIARKYGVTKQAVWSLLNTRPQRSPARTVPCSSCAALIVSDGAVRHDIGSALCLDCLELHPNVSFAQRLRALRLAAGLSRTDLAVRSGIAPGSIRAYEDDSRRPHPRTLRRLAQLLGNELLPDTIPFRARTQLSGAS